MQDFGLPADVVEARRVAYAKFVNEVAVAIHAADPNHPVTSTDAYTGAWPYYKAHSPGAGPARGQLLRRDRRRSSRTGSPAATPSRTSSPRPARTASGRCPTTSTACPTEPTDLQKRAGYTASWNAIKAHPGVALGATEFHYGLENDFGGVWLNTYHRRLAAARATTR